MGSEPPSALHSESELEQFFDLALDLLCIAGFDGYFKRVNPAYVRTLGYPRWELMSRPFFEFVYPDDVQSATDVLACLLDGKDVIGFEHRVICGDGSVRWLQWNTRTLPERRFAYCIGRDVTDRRRADAELRETQRMVEASRDELARLAQEQAALRRVATLVARGAPPEELFPAVTEEVGRVLETEMANLGRYETDAVVIVGSVGEHFPVGTRFTLGGKNIGALVFETGRSVRFDNYAEATGPGTDRVRGLGVRSAVGLPIFVEDRLWGVINVATTKAEPLPADTEARLGSFTELVAMAISNAQARTEVAASRVRIVASCVEERRRVVRDLHDGAQQRLVHTVITLKQARQALGTEETAGAALVTEGLDHAERALAELRELAHGILPAVLTSGGLRAGVDALASRMPLPVKNSVSVGRLSAVVEATAYFVVSEALTNVAKHARASHAEVMARIEDGTLAVKVRDDGMGGARPDGSGLVGLAHRLAALHGRLCVQSPADGGTLIAAAIPLAGSVRAC